ncbi:hypothetical protein [Pedobacter sp. SYSU D00535]|uniref:hypothetical protein n=1 Tax=Pedobacter sp. SYSU D00535 TaxID=2810308 RepID=UPI001A963A0F|nr:hypothetical protein [Pedobacter sp. SYSU D00535]
MKKVLFATALVLAGLSTINASTFNYSSLENETVVLQDTSKKAKKGKNKTKKDSTSTTQPTRDTTAAQ